MPRIRSTFPGQWTDSSFVRMSVAARLLTIAIRNFADDNGVFVWDPIEIKMRCLPADNLVIEQLLDEMIATRQVGRYEKGGRKFGIIRNFKKYQKPKYPTAEYPLPTPEEICSVQNPDEPGLFPTSAGFCTEPVPNSYGTKLAEGEEEIRGEERRRDRAAETAPPAPPAPARRGKAAGGRPRSAGGPQGVRCPDGDLPPDWITSANEFRAKHGYEPISENDAKRRWVAFQEYWMNLPGRSGFKVDWRRTWHANNVSNMTEKRFPVGQSVGKSKFTTAL